MWSTAYPRAASVASSNVGVPGSAIPSLNDVSVPGFPMFDLSVPDVYKYEIWKQEFEKNGPSGVEPRGDHPVAGLLPTVVGPGAATPCGRERGRRTRPRRVVHPGGAPRRHPRPRRFPRPGDGTAGGSATARPRPEPVPLAATLRDHPLAPAEAGRVRPPAAPAGSARSP